jgi:hypothetical protein
LYKYKIVSLTSREKYRLSVSKNRVAAEYLNLRGGSDKRMEKMTVGNFTKDTEDVGGSGCA